MEGKGCRARVLAQYKGQCCREGTEVSATIARDLGTCNRHEPRLQAMVAEVQSGYREAGATVEAPLAAE